MVHGCGGERTGYCVETGPQLLPCRSRDSLRQPPGRAVLSMLGTLHFHMLSSFPIWVYHEFAFLLTAPPFWGSVTKVLSYSTREDILPDLVEQQFSKIKDSLSFQEDELKEPLTFV